MLTLDEIAKRTRFSTEAIDSMQEQVELLLEEITMPLGTGAMLERLWLSKPPQETYTLFVALLAQVRQREGARRLWRYTGKKNQYGKPSIEWLPQEPFIKA